jgi:hypothetical protein
VAANLAGETRLDIGEAHIIRPAAVGAMTAGSLSAAKVIAEEFPWSNYRTLMDIGTAQGCLPVQIADVHPHISGGGFDLPELSAAFADYVRENGLSGRLRFQPGNFFEDDLPAADVLVFGRALHRTSLPKKCSCERPIGRFRAAARSWSMRC